MSVQHLILALEVQGLESHPISRMYSNVDTVVDSSPVWEIRQSILSAGNALDLLSLLTDHLEQVKER